MKHATGKRRPPAKATDAALAQSASLLRATLEATGDGILVTGLSGIVGYNRRFAEMWRIPAALLDAGDDEAAVRHALPQLQDPDAFRAGLEALRADPLAIARDLIEFADGRCFERFSIPQIVNGEPVGRVFSFRDITEQRHAETALRESERRLRALIDNASEGIVLLGADGEIAYASPAATRAFGYRLDDVRGRPVTEFLHGDDVDLVTRLFRQVIERPELRTTDRARTRHRDGSWRTIEGTFTNLLNEPGVNAIVLHFRDVTESLALQRRLSQAERLEAIGRLAGGVAHDFNNLLTAIVGHAELLRDVLPAGSEGLEDLAEIEKAATRATSLTQQLLAFSRRQVLQPQVLDLNQVVEGMRRMLDRLIGEDIHLVVRPGKGVGHVRADPAQMEQVLLNLVVNARDAMPRGGSVVIETANRDLDEWYARQHGAVGPGTYVLLTVTDTGHGMDRTTSEHIFEPFFTTRAKGTGLGLATVYGVISQSGGNVTVDSEPGLGTTFAIFLPRVEAPAESAQPARHAGERAQGTETILVVEDEPVVRDLAAKVLRQHGYTVLVAASGEEALLAAARHEGPLDLVLSDVVMPGMSGPQTWERLAGARAGLRVLFMSGYTDEAMHQHGLAEGAMPFLPKPFTPWSLTAKVREVLEAPRG
jgi:PAS domain S-box-containing protein